MLKLEGFEDTILATWSGAPKACLRCLVAGHSTSLCPKKLPNAGERLDPDKRIDRGVTQKGKKAVLASSAKPQTKKGIPATQATVAKISATVVNQSHNSATQATGSGSGSGTKAQGSNPMLLGTEEQRGLVAMDVAEVELPTEMRVTTPPPFEVEEAVTPKKGGKRMAKDDLWQPSVEELKDYLEGNDLCVGCWKIGHLIFRCPTNQCEYYNPTDVLKNLNFQPFLKKWSQSRKKKGKKWQLADVEAVVIPPYCFECKEVGHMSGSEECLSKIDT